MMHRNFERVFHMHEFSGLYRHPERQVVGYLQCKKTCESQKAKTRESEKASNLPKSMQPVM